MTRPCPTNEEVISEVAVLDWTRAVTAMPDSADVKRLRKGGRRIVVWDVNSAGDAAAMRAYGVDFIVTDDPESIGGR